MTWGLFGLFILVLLAAAGIFCLLLVDFVKEAWRGGFSSDELDQPVTEKQPDAQ